MIEIIVALCGVGLGAYIFYLSWRIHTLEIQMEVILEEYKKRHGCLEDDGK